MRTIPYQTVVNKISEMCAHAACELPGDVLEKIKEAHASEPFPRAKNILDQIIENSSLASSDHMPLCQDTGFAVFFVSVGTHLSLDNGKTIADAINEGTAKGYKEGFLRKSIVKDPLFERANTGDNTPALIHLEQTEGDSLTITLLPKGGGCENMSYLAMLKPSDGKEGVVNFVKECIIRSGGNPCPPLIVGIGIGGTADKACFLAKKALIRETGSHNSDKLYAQFEDELLSEINQTGVGPMGLGGRTTALAVHIEHFPCHIASMPVAVNLNCHSARRATVTL